MKNIFLPLAFIFLPSLGFAQEVGKLKASGLLFTENKNQWPHNILYKAEFQAGSIYLEKNCLTFDLRDGASLHKLLEYKYASDRSVVPTPEDKFRGHAYRMKFNASSPEVRITGEEAASDHVNYFIGKDPAKWASRVHKFRTVRYSGLWAGVDLRLLEYESHMKYELTVSPGADPGQISFDYEGTDGLSLRNGNLVIRTSVNKVTEISPVAWQDRAGGREKVPCRFRLKGNRLSFSFPEGYYRDAPLVIDPILVFSSYSGSSSDNWGYSATYDNLGFLYGAGICFGDEYPVTLGAYQASLAGGVVDISISKFDTTGSCLICATYLGGSGTEVPNSMVVNNSNELIVLGSTGSDDYPVTPYAFQTSFSGGPNYTLDWVLDYPNGSDIVLTRFSADGSSLLASTFIGGLGNDGLNTVTPLKHNYGDEARGEVVVDENDNIYVATSTQSTNFPVTPNTFQPAFAGGTQDGCVFKLDKSLSLLLWSSYLGGTNDDACYNILLDNQDNAYVSGGTNSIDLPVTPGALQPAFGGGLCDGFMARISANGQNLMAATYYGTDAYDQTYFIDNDKQGNIYVTGQTGVTGNAYIQNVNWYAPSGGQFISKLNSGLTTRIWSTAFGTGPGPDIAQTAFMVDLCGNIYVSGWGSLLLNGFGGTTGLPVSGNAFQPTTDNSDFYFLVIDNAASGLIYGTFFGGSSLEHVDGGTSRFDKKGIIYEAVCAGCGGYDDFPTTPGAWSNINGSTNCNLGVIKFDFKLALAVANFNPPVSGCTPYTCSFTNTSIPAPGPAVTYQWNFGDGGTSTALNPAHTFTQSGVYQVRLIVTDSATCNISDTLVRQLVVLSNSTDTLPAKYICPGEHVQIGILPFPDTTVSFNWVPGTGLNNSHISNPIASPAVTTHYMVYVSNDICTDTILQDVLVVVPQAEAGNDTLICTDTLTLKAFSPTDSVRFIWSSNPQFTDTLNFPLTSNTAFVTLTAPHTFYLKVLYHTCSAIDSIFIDFGLWITGMITHPLACHSDCDGALSLNVLSGTPPFRFLWNTGDTTTALSGLCAGTYTCTITDSTGCVSVNVIHLNEPDQLVTEAVVQDAPCEEVCLGTANVLTTGGTIPYNYSWSNGQGTGFISHLCEGTYTVTVTDSNQCQTSDTVVVGITTVFQNIAVTVEKDTLYQGQQSGILLNLIQGCSYQWSPVTGLSDPTIHNPVATPMQTTTYIVILTDTYGCTYTDSARIVVLDVYCREPYIFVPNAFTPNGDQQNDAVYVRSNMIENMNFSIYNRWGEKVFEASDPGRGWDGTFRGKECEPGVYVYQLDVTCHNKSVFKKKGNITLIR